MFLATAAATAMTVLEVVSRANVMLTVIHHLALQAVLVATILERRMVLDLPVYAAKLRLIVKTVVLVVNVPKTRK